MMFDLKMRHIVGILIGLGVIILSFIFLYPTESRWFKPLLGVGFFVGIFQFWIDIIRETKRQNELEEKFLEFMRAVSDGVRAGIPIPKAILELSDRNFGALNPYVKKLVHQIEWGFPLRSSLVNFARDTNNKIVKRSVSIIIEAEHGGGKISDVLGSVTSSVLQIRKIKEERKSNTFSQIIQGYFVYFMFIGIMIVLQVYLLPQLSDVSATALTGVGSGFGNTGGLQVTGEPVIDFSVIFVSLIIIQGFFAGLLVGKFSEGSLKPGLKHSLIMVFIGYVLFSSIVGF